MGRMPPHSGTSHALIQGEPRRRVSADLAGRIPGLDWAEPSSQTGDLLYAACAAGSLVEALSVVRADAIAWFRGLPKACFVLQGGDERSRLLVSRRLLAMAHDIGAPCEALHLHEEANSPELGAIAVISCQWEHRQAMTALLISLLNADPAIQRMVLRGGMSKQRLAYDQGLLDQLLRAGGLRGGFWGTRQRTWRFSEFSVRETASWMRSVRFVCRFDEYEGLELAYCAYESTQSAWAAHWGQDRLDRVIRLEPNSNFLDLVRPSGQMRPGPGSFVDTDLLCKDKSMTLSVRHDVRAGRQVVASWIAASLGLDGRTLRAGGGPVLIRSDG